MAKYSSRKCHRICASALWVCAAEFRCFCLCLYSLNRKTQRQQQQIASKLGCNEIKIYIALSQRRRRSRRKRATKNCCQNANSRKTKPCEIFNVSIKSEWGRGRRMNEKGKEKLYNHFPHSSFLAQIFFRATAFSSCWRCLCVNFWFLNETKRKRVRSK